MFGFFFVYFLLNEILTLTPSSLFLSLSLCHSIALSFGLYSILTQLRVYLMVTLFFLLFFTHIFVVVLLLCTLFSSNEQTFKVKSCVCGSVYMCNQIVKHFSMCVWVIFNFFPFFMFFSFFFACFGRPQYLCISCLSAFY